MNTLIAWFTRNSVAANLLMLVIVLAGLKALPDIPLEILSRFQGDIVTVRVPYLGALPAQVEQDIIVRVEEAVQDLEGIKEIKSTATEGYAAINIEVDSGYKPRDLLDDIKNRVDAIDTFPDDAEQPNISIEPYNMEVISVAVAAELDELELRRLGEQVRDDLLTLPRISQVVLTGVRPYEISIEVSELTLKRYGLTFEAVATAINRSSLDIPAGSIKTNSGEVLLRGKGQAYNKADLEKIIILTRQDGTRLTLGDIAEIKDGFEENKLEARFNKLPCVMIEVYRIGDQNAIDIAKAVKRYIAGAKLPPGVEITYWRDRSNIIKLRVATLVSNAVQGGILVFLVLTLFLRLTIAVWVCVGIPISFMGAVALMPEFGVTINVTSLFAFILVLGIVVDDAIVTGENIFTHLGRSNDPTAAAISGAQEVALPVTFGVLTTIAAFTPMLAVEGQRGQLFASIALIVIPVLVFSLIESKLILPAHLKHARADRSAFNLLTRIQDWFARGLNAVITDFYQPLLKRALQRRYLTISIFLGVAIVLLSLLAGGRLGFTFFPRVESETAKANLTMPIGTPYSVTARNSLLIVDAARRIQEKYRDETSGKSIIKDIYSVSGDANAMGNPQSHVGKVMMEIAPPEERVPFISGADLVREWRKLIGPISGAEELSFRSDIAHGSNPIDIQLQSNNIDDLQVIAEQIKARLRELAGVYDISDSFEAGKEEISLKIRPQAELLGLTLSDLAHQVRQAFYGLEVQRIQRGRDEVKIMLRYPLSERASLNYLETMSIRTPAGVEVPFTDVAEAEMGRSAASIMRTDRSRTLNITAEINKQKGDAGRIKAEIMRFLPGLLSQHPMVRYSLEGEDREQRESFASLSLGALFVFVTIYAMLAIPFRSYLQPFIVMSVIPFGLIGAILGHLIVGIHLTVNSVLGMLALSGVVINDSLVLVDFINRAKKTGILVMKAAVQAGGARFRAILLTSLTTFVGLVPVMLEKSTQAQFLIPMAVSLGFGILFATFITLILVPVNYRILEDIKGLFQQDRSANAQDNPERGKAE